MTSLSSRSKTYPKGVLEVRLESLAVVLLLVPPFFSTFFPNANLVICALMLLTLLLLLFSALNQSIRCGSLKHRESFPALLVVITLFFIFILVNNNCDLQANKGFRWIVQFGGTLCALWLLLFCRGSHWIPLAFRLIAAFGLFYSLATIFFWLVPNAYDVVYPYLLGRASAISIIGSGYRAGLTTHYSTNGMYTALGFLACGFLAMKSKREKGWIVAAIFCFFALVLTTKRAHLAFGLLAFCCAYLAFNSRKKLGSFGRFLLVAATALFALYVASLFNETILKVFDRISNLADDDSFGGRSEFYQLCLSMFGKNPIFGLGWGSYTPHFNQTSLGLRYIANGFTSMDAHNVYLQVLAEEGLVGFILFAVVLISALVFTTRTLFSLNKAYAHAKNDAMHTARALLAGSIAIQLFFVMYCITGNPLYDAQVFAPWLLSLGVAFTVAREASATELNLGKDAAYVQSRQTIRPREGVANA